MKKILLAISVLLLTVSMGYGEGVPVKVTIEPLNARTKEIGVYIFREDEPFKIKVTLENTSNRQLALLTPGMQNHYDKVFYFQILDLKGNIIRADERGTSMTHAETIGPEKITLMPKEGHSFYAYLNSNKGSIEHHHFFGLNLFSELFQDRYYFVKGVYDTTKYSKLDTPGSYYHDIDKVIAYSNDIQVEIVKKNETKPLQLTIKSDKQVYKAGEPIILTTTLKNTSRHDYSYLIPDVYDNNVRFWSVETKKGQLERIRPYGGGHLRKNNYAVIGSNDSINYNSDVTTIWKFPAGTYKIKANYKGENWYRREDNSIAEMEDCFTGTLASNTITIEVKGKKQIEGRAESPIIKYSLHEMTDVQIEEYFKQCISNNLIFLYRGSLPPSQYLVDKSDMDFAKKLKWVDIGCTGGVDEGYKFNKLMIKYLKNKKK